MSMIIWLKSIFGELLMNSTLCMYGEEGDSLLYYLYSKIINKIGFSIFPVVSIQKYTEIGGRVTSRKIKDHVGKSYIIQYLSNEANFKCITKKLHPIYYSIFNNIVIQGESDILVDEEKKCVINDFCYNKPNNTFFVDGLLYRSEKNIAILRGDIKTKQMEYISEGIMVSGKFAYNYYHQMMENLMRLVYLDDSNIPTNVPLIIDRKTKEVSSFKKILTLLIGKKIREIIVIDSNILYKVGKLHYIDHPNYLSPHIRSIKETANDLFLYDFEAIKLFKNKMMLYKSKKKFPKRIFLTRKLTKIRHFNEREVFEYLKTKGFKSIAPEDYSFEEQMQIFNSAEYIVGGTGAAFTNLIFCQKGCKIVCFRSSDKGEEPPIFNSLAKINDCVFWYYTPDYTFNPNSVHSNYRIDINSFKVKMASVF